MPQPSELAARTPSAAILEDLPRTLRGCQIVWSQ